MKGNLTLVLFRTMSIAIAVVINVLIIKLLPLSEVGEYYILGTIAYFGNALFFVGFDFALQRKIHNISNTKSIDFSSLRSYCAKTLPFGIISAFVLSTIVSFAGNAHNWLGTALLCAALSAISFMVSLSRNILQIAGEKYRVSYSLLLEQVAKLCLCFIMILFFGASAIVIIGAFILASLAPFILNYYHITRCLQSVDENASYAVDSNDISKIILPVSAGGVLNWLQLQAYRPLLGKFFDQAELVGAVSFLTMLGATVTSASLGVLAQVWTPKQFATKGDTSRRFVILSAVSILALALLAYPSAYVFLRLLDKESLYGLEYLVSLGVIVEGGNFILGVLGNHSSLTRGSFVPSMLAGIIGFVTVSVIILTVDSNQEMGPGMIGFALAVSQCVAVAALLPVLLRKLSKQTNP